MSDRRIGDRRLAPWTDPRVSVLPPERWADYGKLIWPRGKCRVCGRDALGADHGRCAVSMRAAKGLSA